VQDKLEAESKIYWEERTSKMKDELAIVVTESATLSEERKQELTGIIFDFKDIIFDLSANDVFIKEEFENRKPHFGVLDLTTWYVRAAAWIIGIFSLILLIWLISGILSIAIQIAIPVLAILAVYSLVKNFMRR